MLTILINGRPAVIKENTSFEFVSENPLFSDADEYSLNISLPIRDCQVNADIFGFIFVPGVDLKITLFDMEILAGFIHLKGAGTVTGFNETEVKIQFLGNRSAQNFYSDLDKVYINTLNLGEVPEEWRIAADVFVEDAWMGHGAGMDFVALPWVNEATGNIINDTKPDPDAPTGYPGAYRLWVEPEEAKDVSSYIHKLSWQPYLYFIAEKICNAIGFSFDFEFWRNSKYYHLLLCHAVPPTWNFRWNSLLPHWSVLEFFRNLEPLLEGRFDIDMIRKSIVLIPYVSNVDSSIDNVDSSEVVIDDIISEFSSDTFDKSDSCKLLSMRYMGYTVPDSKIGKLFSCQWFVDSYCDMGIQFKIPQGPDCSFNVMFFDNAEAFSAYARNNDFAKYSPFQVHPVLGADLLAQYLAFYLREEDRLVTYRTVLTNNKIVLGSLVLERNVPARVPAMLNNLGSRCVPVDRELADNLDVTLAISPVIVDDTDGRRMMFINPGESNEMMQEPILDYDDKSNIYGYAVYESRPMYLIDKGKDEGADSPFSCLSLGFYPDYLACRRSADEVFPIVDFVEFYQNWSAWKREPKWSLSLKDKFKDFPKVNPNVKYEFSFIANRLPDVNSVFIIRGHKYLCEKITASFSADGLSQKFKGIFWKIV